MDGIRGKSSAGVGGHSRAISAAGKDGSDMYRDVRPPIYPGSCRDFHDSCAMPVPRQQPEYVTRSSPRQGLGYSLAITRKSESFEGADLGVQRPGVCDAEVTFADGFACERQSFGEHEQFSVPAGR